MCSSTFQVCGIQGSFKVTCEHSMRVLRDNKESLSAVLEAFVYDPLTAWRLLQTTDGDRQGTKGGGARLVHFLKIMDLTKYRPWQSQKSILTLLHKGQIAK